MKKSNGLVTKRNQIIPNERRRQTWRKHRLGLIDRRSKWFYQQQALDNESSDSAQEEAPVTPALKDKG